MNLDLGSLASTTNFAESFKARGTPLHVLVCNAGMAYGPDGNLYIYLYYTNSFPYIMRTINYAIFLLNIFLVNLSKASDKVYSGASWLSFVLLVALI